MKNEDITVIIMAGGRGQRMENKDKGLVLLAGIPLCQRVVDRLRGQAGALIINANRNQKEYSRFGYEVISDKLPGFLGPLAAMDAAFAVIKTDWCVFVSCDTPFLPLDLVSRLHKARKGKKAVCVHDGVRLHPIPLLLHHSVQPQLEYCLRMRKLQVSAFLKQIGCSIAAIPNQTANFININSIAELNYCVKSKEMIDFRHRS